MNESKCVAETVEQPPLRNYLNINSSHPAKEIRVSEAFNRGYHKVDPSHGEEEAYLIV